MHRTVIGLALILANLGAHAALLGRAPLTPNGTDYQAYYDDALNITWLADANYAQTSGYDADGRLDWDAAQDWVAFLNANSHLNAQGWRLPFVVDTGVPGCDLSNGGTDCGRNVQTIDGTTVYSEMAHLYYVTLGNVSALTPNGEFSSCWPNTNECLKNTAPFVNLHPDAYWTGTLYAALPADSAWYFYFYEGYQFDNSKSVTNYTLPVIDGDPFAPVPIPAAVWLLGSALGVLGVLKRRAAG